MAHPPAHVRVCLRGCPSLVCSYQPTGHRCLHPPRTAMPRATKAGQVHLQQVNLQATPPLSLASHVQASTATATQATTRTSTAAPRSTISSSWRPPGSTAPQVWTLHGRQRARAQGRHSWLARVPALLPAAPGNPTPRLTGPAHAAGCVAARVHLTLTQRLRPTTPAGQDAYQQEAYTWFTLLGGRWSASVYVSWDDVTAPGVMALLTCVRLGCILRPMLALARLQ